MAAPDIRRVRSEREVEQAAALFDAPPRPGATRRFLDAPDHHLLLAWDGARPVGMVSGVELTHPDKGTEMFLYELAVAEDARNRGVGRALVSALADLARERGCYGMWVLTDADNPGALRAYAAAGAGPPCEHVMLTWDL
jgi:GNAT superfamily N-acetyltransferase